MPKFPLLIVFSVNCFLLPLLLSDVPHLLPIPHHLPIPYPLSSPLTAHRTLARFGQDPCHSQEKEKDRDKDKESADGKAGTGPSGGPPAAFVWNKFEPLDHDHGLCERII